VDVADPGDACAATARETLNRLSTRPSLEMSRPVSSGPAHSRQVRCSSINDGCSNGCGDSPRDAQSGRSLSAASAEPTWRTLGACSVNGET